MSVLAEKVITRDWLKGPNHTLEGYKKNGGYEQLKDLTRGRDGVTRDTVRAFIQGLAIPDADKERLLALTPAGYTGKAAELARRA